MPSVVRKTPDATSNNIEAYQNGLDSEVSVWQFYSTKQKCSVLNKESDSKKRNVLFNRSFGSCGTVSENTSCTSF